MFDHLSVDDRIAAADLKTDKLVNLLIEIIGLNQTNAIVTYSDRLSGQIGRSFAANAFNQSQRALLLYEVLRLCALWDKPDENTFSIPTVIALISNPDVQQRLNDDYRSSWKHEPAFADEQSAKHSTLIKEAIDTASKVQSGSKLADLVNFRNKELAHSLSVSRAEQKGSVFATPKFGHENELLNVTVEIVDKLNQTVRRAGFDFEHSKKIARKYSESLWFGCTFQPLK